MTTWLEKQGYKSHKYRAGQITFWKVGEKLVCPVCLENKTKWHVHHCYPRVLGGTDAKNNLLLLCTMCHRKWHEAEDDEMMFARTRVFSYMAMVYGDDFELLKRLPTYESLKDITSDEWKAIGEHWFVNGMDD